MKVYDRKTLLITILGAIFLIGIYVIKILRREFNFYDFVWILMGLKLVWNGLRASLTRTGYEEDQKCAARGKRVYRKLFGRLAPVMPYSVIIVYLTTLCLAALLLRVYILPPVWIFLLILLIPVGYAAWFGWIVSKHMDLEEAQELLQANDPPAMAEDIRSESHDI